MKIKSPQSGERYTKNGVSIDIHEIRKGVVYYRRWSRRKKFMRIYDGLFRISLVDWKVKMEFSIKRYGAPTITNHSENKRISR